MESSLVSRALAETRFRLSQQPFYRLSRLDLSGSRFRRFPRHRGRRTRPQIRLWRHSIACQLPESTSQAAQSSAYRVFVTFKSRPGRVAEPVRSRPKRNGRQPAAHARGHATAEYFLAKIGAGRDAGPKPYFRFARLRRRISVAPTRPAPNRESVMGSGTALTETRSRNAV